MQPDELTAIGDLAGDAVAGIAGQVQTVHRGIAQRVWSGVGPASALLSSYCSKNSRSQCPGWETKTPAKPLLKLRFITPSGWVGSVCATPAVSNVIVPEASGLVVTIDGS